MAVSRRSFLMLSGSLLLGAAHPPRQVADPPEWLPGVRLGRMTESRIRLYNRPHPEGRETAFQYRDEVVTIVRDVVGPGFYPHNHVWFETPAGYAYSSWVQPVQYSPAAPLAAVPAEGVYGEVCVPYTDALSAPDPLAPVLYRLYYPTTYQVAGRELAPDGSVWYRLHDENVIKMYARAKHLRLVTPDEFHPLAPSVEDKSIVVSLGQQRLAAFEGPRQVFRATIASGRNFFGPDATTVSSLTPAGEHPLWQKRASRHTLAPRVRAAQVQV